jgi:NAD(P)-dependent dehydrogenase (short-subunit alcohol dehydrogenase family)
LDVDDDASVTAAARWVADRFGRCDALVNNAAIDYDTDQQASTADLDRVHGIVETNLFGAWRTTLASYSCFAEVSAPGSSTSRAAPAQ